MIRVTDVQGVSSVKKIKKKSSDSAGFSDAMNVADSSSQAVSDAAQNVAGLSSLTGLVDISVFNNSTYGSGQEQIDYGRDILSELDDLRMGLLSGNVSTQKLQEIVQESHSINNNETYNLDPKLQDIIKDIELRAAVELAKLQ